MVREMLIRFRDALGQQRAGLNGADGHDSRLLEPPRAFNDAMRELDRCLTAMRVFEPALRWHLIAWYVDVDVRQVTRWRFLIRNGERRKVESGFQLEVRRHRDADQNRADQGVAWLANRYRWDRVHLKAIHQAAGLAG